MPRYTYNGFNIDSDFELDDFELDQAFSEIDIMSSGPNVPGFKSSWDQPFIQSPIPTRKVTKPEWYDELVTGGLRTVPGIVGGIGGGVAGAGAGGFGAIPGSIGGGALGSGFGELAAQAYERERGIRDEGNAMTVLAETLAGGIPIAGKGKGLKALASAGAKGAALATGGSTARTLTETGELPKKIEDYLIPAGIGFTGGAVGQKIGEAFVIKPQIAREQKAAQKATFEQAQETERVRVFTENQRLEHQRVTGQVKEMINISAEQDSGPGIQRLKDQNFKRMMTMNMKKPKDQREAKRHVIAKAESWEPSPKQVEMVIEVEKRRHMRSLGLDPDNFETSLAARITEGQISIQGPARGAQPNKTGITKPGGPPDQMPPPTGTILDLNPGPKINDTDGIDLAAQMVISPNPLIREAIQADPELADKMLTRGMGMFRRTGDYLITSLKQRLANLGPSGKILAQKYSERDARTAQFASEFDARFDEVDGILGKDPAKWDELFDVISGKKVTQEIDVLQAKQLMKQIIDVDMPQRALQADLKSGGETFKTVQGFVPMNYGPEFWEDSKRVAAAFREKFPNMSENMSHAIASGQTSPELLEKMLQKGDLGQMTTDDMTKILKYLSWRQTAEYGRSPTSKLVRDLDLPGYKKGIETWKQHAFNLGSRIAKKEVLPGDLRTSLIATTTNAGRARTIVNQIDRHSKKASGLPYGFRRMVGQYTMMRFLGNFAFTNNANAVGIPVEADIASFAKAMRDMFTDRQAANKFADEAGAKYSIGTAILEEAAQGGPLTKMWSKPIAWSEDKLRTISAGAGRYYAQNLFHKAKNGAATPFELEKLKSYVYASSDEKLGNILDQPELTEKQLKDAAFAFTERTQGTRSVQNFSQFLDDAGPFASFRRYAAQGTKNIKDNLFGPDISGWERAKNATKIIAFGQLAGYGISSAQAGMQGVGQEIGDLITGEGENKNRVAKAYEKRSDYVNYLFKGMLKDPMPPVAAKFVDNALKGWMIGILADFVIAGMQDEEEIASEVIGAPGDIARQYTSVRDITIGAARGDMRKTKTVARRVGRDVLRSAPFGLGRGLAAAILPTKGEQ